MSNGQWPVAPDNEPHPDRSSGAEAELAMECSPQGPPLPPLDPVAIQAVRLLEQPPAERSWLAAAILLAISLFVFATTGLLHAQVDELAIVAAVLLLHEAGHYCGMVLFNYRDVKMFFIPFFGAAVSGRPSSAAAYKEIIVLMLGPLPGIAFGIGLGVACLFYDSAAFRSAASMFVAINAFNLSPILPLDGGRILHQAVFSRQHHVEAAFRLLMAALTGLLALATGSWFFGVVGITLVMGTPTTFRIGRAAKQLRWEYASGDNVDVAAPLDRETAAALVDRMRPEFPLVKQPQALANIVRQTWQRIHARPPGLLMTGISLAVCTLAVFCSLTALTIFHVPIPWELEEPQPDGSVKRCEVVYQWGRIMSSTEVDAAGLENGPHVEYYPGSDRVREQGWHQDGDRVGVWKTFREDGTLESQHDYGGAGLQWP